MARTKPPSFDQVRTDAISPISGKADLLAMAEWLEKLPANAAPADFGLGYIAYRIRYALGHHGKPWFGPEPRTVADIHYWAKDPERRRRLNSIGDHGHWDPALEVLGKMLEAGMIKNGESVESAAAHAPPRSRQNEALPDPVNRAKETRARSAINRDAITVKKHLERREPVYTVSGPGAQQLWNSFFLLMPDAKKSDFNDGQFSVRKSELKESATAALLLHELEQAAGKRQRN